MICRELTLDEGRSGWLLVSQVRHAHLSGDLAAHCALDLGAQRIGISEAEFSRARIDLRRRLIATIQRHDDGWAAWDSAPRLDPEHERPRSFMEMPLADSLAIWSASIDRARRVGPFEAWTIAGHFLNLLGRSKTHDRARRAAAWSTEIERQRRDWLEQWAAETPLGSQAVAQRAVLWLQFFDALSLWLCCECPVDFGEPRSARIGEGGPLKAAIRSLAAGRGAAPRPNLCGEVSFQPLTVEPWRFSDAAFDAESQAHWIPARVYRDAAELIAAQTPLRLRWRLAKRGRP